MKRIIRSRLQMKPIACPRFIPWCTDAGAELLYVATEEVFKKAAEWNVITYAISGTECSHYGEWCTFDFSIRKHGILNPAVHQMAAIIRGSDNSRVGRAFL